jgi:hypothetical protein
MFHQIIQKIDLVNDGIIALQWWSSLKQETLKFPLTFVRLVLILLCVHDLLVLSMWSFFIFCLQFS